MGVAAAAPRDRIAVIDLGPADPAVRQQIETALVAAKLAIVSGGGVEEALAGDTRDLDAAELAVALDDARAAFGDLDCKRVTASATTAIGLASQRQAAGLPVPELPRAWAYVFLCADRSSDTDAALFAAGRLRALGGSPEVDTAQLAKYPTVDVIAGRDLLTVEIKTDVGAAVWVDGEAAGTAPAKLVLPAGRHLIAAAAGTKRGFVTGTVVRQQPVIEIALVEQASPWAKVAALVASWHGEVPAPADLATVLGEVHARIAIVRHGDQIEAWGSAGRAEVPHLLGGEDGKGKLDEAPRIAALVADRIASWNDRAPDPDRPLLVEKPGSGLLTDKKEAPTPWWVYAVIGGALAASGIVVYAHSSGDDVQHVELHYP
jgi:hypothetical protein